jgi:hypothetical protein
VKNEIEIENLLQWRRQRAEDEAPPAPSGASLLKLIPWWEMWPDRFAQSVRRLASIRLSYAYAMTQPVHGHSGHPVATLISREDDEKEAPARVLYVNVRDARLRLRFQLPPVTVRERGFEVTFVSETGLQPILSAHAELSRDDEYRVDVELPSELAVAWQSLRVTDPMPFRFILRPALNKN